MSGRRLLWCGDAVVQTGFARVTHEICDRLHGKGWDVGIFGVNHNGYPHAYPYPVYPVKGTVGEDLADVADHFKPDVVLILTDPWLIDDYLKREATKVPIVGYSLLDGLGLNTSLVTRLNDLASLGMAAPFGAKCIREAGYTKEPWIAQYGVDRGIFHPIPQKEARLATGMIRRTGEHGFVFGNVNRNAKRKRLDLTMWLWSRWWERAGRPDDAWLYLGCADHDEGWRIRRLAQSFRIADRVLAPLKVQNGVARAFTAWQHFGIEQLAAIYSSLDVQISTTLGEGFGLTTLEGMACGVPQIAPKWAALEDWAADAAELVACSSIQVSTGGINTIGGVVDGEKFVAALDRAYRDRAWREDRRAAGLRVAESLTWDDCTARVELALADALERALAEATKSREVA